MVVPTPPGKWTKVLSAEIGYLVMIPFALVERGLSALVRTLTYFLPLSDRCHQILATWSSDSALALNHAITYASSNIYVKNKILLLHGNGWMQKDPGDLA